MPGSAGDRRPRTRALLAALGLILGAFLLATPAQAQDPETIRGVVNNGTVGAQLPSGLTVILEGLRGADRLTPRAASVDGEGGFEFQNLDSGLEYAYVLSVEYEGVIFHSELLQLADGGIGETALTIYEVTNQDPGISFQSVTRLLRRQTADALSVVEFAEIEVPGDRAYLPVEQPGTPPPIRFTVPEGAFDLQPLSGFAQEDVVIGGPGFAVFVALPPGTVTLVYGYQIALTGGSRTFEWSLSLPAQTVRLLSEIAGLETQVTGLAGAGTTSFGDLQVTRWETSDTPPGASFTISVSDTTVPVVLRAIRVTTADRWALIAAAASAVLAGALALWRRKWRRATAPDDAAEARRLLTELAELERRQGEQAKSEREETQQALRAELLTLLQRRPDLAVELRRDGLPGAERSKPPSQTP